MLESFQRSNLDAFIRSPLDARGFSETEGKTFWQSTCYGNNLYAAVGSMNYPEDHSIMTSPNAIAWANILQDPQRLEGVCYGNGRYVAVGWSDSVVSLDGITWVKYTGASSMRLYGVCYGNGLYVGVGMRYGNNGGIYTSLDGGTWVYRFADSVNAPFWSVCYGNGLYVAIGNRMRKSVDAITWLGTSPSGPWRSVCYGNGLYVAVGTGFSYSAPAMSSADAINWNVHSTPFSGALYGVCYGNGLYVAVGGEGATGPTKGMIATSTDGAVWIQRTCPTNSILKSVCYGNGLYVAVGEWRGESDKRVVISSDGINWTGQSTP